MPSTEHGFNLKLRFIGDVYIPGKFADIVSENTSLKLFGQKEISQLNRIFNHLRRGGVAVVSGQWDKILEALSYLEKRKRELSSGVLRDLSSQKAQRREPTYRRKANRWYERHYQLALSRLMVIAHKDQLLGIEPSIHIPYLLELVGEASDSSDGLPFLVPVPAIQRLQTEMEQFFYISALDDYVLSFSNVLQPLSQDTIELFREAMVNCAISSSGDAGKRMDILDMGCGCGCLSLIAASVFHDYQVKIMATDIMPEAIATTKLNVQRFVENGKLASGIVETTNSGDLFEPLAERRFHVIIFNAPWVVSQPQSRAEMATCDAEQDTVRRFLHECPEHLNEGGHVILGYSDHSGDKAVERLASFIRDAGLEIVNTFRKRIQSRRQKRKWEAILVYDLEK